MTFPVFSTGEVLRAQDMNAVGLWRVGGGAVSGTTTNFVGCFTSDYTVYRVVIDQPTNTAAGEYYIRYLTGTTATSTNAYRWAYNGHTSAGAGYSSNSAANLNGFLGWETPATGGFGGITLDIFSPNIVTRTLANVSAAFNISGAYATRNGMIVWEGNDQFTGLQISSGGGSSLAGNVSIYGYRKA